MKKLKLCMVVCLLIIIASCAKAIADSYFAYNLQNCNPSETTFIHPFTGTPMKRIIYGFQNNLCIYKEQMPGGMSMECRYPRNMLPEISRYYSDMEKARSNSTTFSTNSGAKYYINGKQVDNPLNTALDMGVCDLK